MSKVTKTAIWFAVIGVIGGLGYWIYKENSKPLPGELVEDMGREHVEDISSIKYNSNPPTSGTHFPLWAKKGVYDRVLSDGYLIHSLEHGYVVISYNCGEKVEMTLPSVMKLKVEGEMSPFTPDTQPPKEVDLPEYFNAQSCKDLVAQLAEMVNRFKRIIVVPRPTLDQRIALTAWRRIMKLDDFDQMAIESFIKAFENRGPEQTIE